MKQNPFRPNNWVPASAFVGREEEIDCITNCIYNTKNGNPQCFSVDGERGIGKTSLLEYAHALSEGFVRDFKNRLNFRCVAIYISLDKDDSFTDIVEKIARQIDCIEGTRKLFHTVLDFAQRFEAAGVRIRAEAPKKLESSALVEFLISEISDMSRRLGDSADAIVLLIDEADKPSETAKLGYLSKALMEGTQRQAGVKFMIGLAGLPDLIPKLQASHESAARIFRNLRLQPLSYAESLSVIESGLAEASKINDKDYRITDTAKQYISALAEGYPHFLQEFCFHAFQYDSDDIIDHHDVTNSITIEHGTLDDIGAKYFSFCYYDVTSDQKELLHLIANERVEWVDIQKLIKNHKLNTILTRKSASQLCTKGAITQGLGETNIYKLRNKAFGAWIRAQSKRIPPQPIG